MLAESLDNREREREGERHREIDQERERCIAATVMATTETVESRCRACCC